MTGLCRHVVALWVALAATAAQAGRPLVTEDADTLDRGQCEWETYTARLSIPGAAATNGWTTQAGCGVGYRSQVALAYSRATNSGLTASGWALVGKTALVPRHDDTLGMALAWGLAGVKAPGASLRHETSYLNLVASQELAKGLTGHANLGWVRSESASASSTPWGLAVEQALAGNIDLTAELYGDDRAKPWLGLGARWAASNRLSLNASWAVQNESPRPRQWTLGFKLAF